MPLAERLFGPPPRPSTRSYARAIASAISASGVSTSASAAAAVHGVSLLLNSVPFIMVPYQHFPGLACSILIRYSATFSHRTGMFL